MEDTTKRPSAEQLQKQVAAYRELQPRYRSYASALKRVLEEACKPHVPEAVVLARAKGVSSFAEKCVRKFEKYPDAANQFTDLCGARVIVQTVSQVKAVRRFVEENFLVVETEDIGLRLGEREFGYRDRHYIIQLQAARAGAVGFTLGEIETIGCLKAELQIRTWAQHAWADTLHDRTYKSPIKPTAEVNRTAALLAALMEDGDRNFDRLASELDGLVSSYAASATREAVEKELSLQQFLFNQESDIESRPALALRLAKLLAALGRHSEVIDLLEPFADKPTTMQAELHLELGAALCRQNRRQANASPYARGLSLLTGVAERLSQRNDTVVLNRHRMESLQARVHSRLGWAYEAQESREPDARRHHARALEIEPANPYYLANLLGFELMSGVRLDDLISSMRSHMKEAVALCDAHSAQAMELPFAFFTAGRIRLLIGEVMPALHSYMRGVHHSLDGAGCVGCEVISDEITWLKRIHGARPMPPDQRPILDFLSLARDCRDCRSDKGETRAVRPPARANLTGPVLIVAGGAASLDPKLPGRLRGPLIDALRSFKGTVISGGTRSGIPGLVGEIAATLASEGTKPFRLVGYRPEKLPDDAPRDDRYDETIRVGSSAFSIEQILANWQDILAAGIKPEDVRVLGVGGGELSAIEYRLGLTLRASVGVLEGTGGAAGAILADPQWKSFERLLPLPSDAATIRAFLREPEIQPPDQAVEGMASALHAGYVAGSVARLPENLRPWAKLPDTYKQASRSQARYSVEILRAVGFVVRPATGSAEAIESFEGAEFDAVVERMAELEHGRWNVERLRAGWRHAEVRDNEHQLHPNIVPWDRDDVLTQSSKDYDRKSVRDFPRLLAGAGLEILRA